MNARAESRTVGHLAPIEPDTSRMSDRSTIRRVASAVAFTFIVVKFPSRMNVVGRLADAATSTMLLPDAASVVRVTVGPLVSVAPKYPAGKFALKIRVASAVGLPLFMLRAA